MRAQEANEPMERQDVPARDPVRVIFADAIGSYLVLLEIARQQRFLEKHGTPVEPVPARGATVPRVTRDTPLGLIGEPAAILQVAEGTDLRIVASFSSTPLSGHLVSRPGITTPDALRDKRIGVRVVGAGVWISTVLALEQLGLSPTHDRITMVPTGSPREIAAALEEGAIDAAMVTVAQSRALQAKGYTALLSDYPAGIPAYGGCLAVTAEYAANHPDAVQGVVTALTEALAFALAEQNRDAVARAFAAALNITDRDTALSNLAELRTKPYVSRTALAKMQSIMATHDLRVANMNLNDYIDDRFVRAIDESGAMARLYDAYDTDRTISHEASSIHAEP